MEAGKNAVVGNICRRAKLVITDHGELADRVFNTKPPRERTRAVDSRRVEFVFVLRVEQMIAGDKVFRAASSIPKKS
jgi:hypothetical protein